jgi:hypothetical protein
VSDYLTTKEELLMMLAALRRKVMEVKTNAERAFRVPTLVGLFFG